MNQELPSKIHIAYISYKIPTHEFCKRQSHRQYHWRSSFLDFVNK